MNWILATVLAASVSGGATFKGQLTVGANTAGAASGTAPAAGGGGGSTLALATLRYNADDLTLANGDKVSSWPSTGTYTDATATLTQGTAAAQPSFNNQDAEMTNSVYLDQPGGTTSLWMKTTGLATPVPYPAIICSLYKADSATPNPTEQHIWEAFAQPGATQNQHAHIYYWRGLDFENPMVTAQRSHHAEWYSYCIELRDGATSKLARNGEQIAQGTFTTGQNQIVDFSVGGIHNAATFYFFYKFTGKIADVAIWGDIDTLGVNLADVSRDFAAEHSIPRASPHPDEPYPYNTWSSTTVCDKSNEYGCVSASNTPQSDGCSVRQIFPEGSGAEPTNTNYGSTGNIMNWTSTGQQYQLCETGPADLVNGHPHISLRPPTASDQVGLTVTGGLQQNLLQPWSICMTIRINAYPAVGNKRYLFTALNGGVQHEEWYFENVGGTTSLNLWGESNEPACATPPGPPCQIATAIATPALATWSALCVQYDGTGSEWALKQQGQAAQTGTWNPDPALYYHTSYSQFFFGDTGGRKAPNMDFTKVSVFGTGVDTEAMVESLATQYGL